MQTKNSQQLVSIWLRQLNEKYVRTGINPKYYIPTIFLVPNPIDDWYRDTNK